MGVLSIKCCKYNQDIENDDNKTINKMSIIKFKIGVLQY